MIFSMLIMILLSIDSVNQNYVDHEKDNAYHLEPDIMSRSVSSVDQVVDLSFLSLCDLLHLGIRILMIMMRMVVLIT